jgi:hypothetical protein
VKEKLARKRDEKCNETLINNRVIMFEQTLGLLEAAFGYLSILYPTDDGRKKKKKKKNREAVQASSEQWREIGLSITLKAHVREVHACDFNDIYGVGDKEESFIKQHHQTGITDDHRYCGVISFKKKMETTLKARSISSHPLVKQHNAKVLHGVQQTKAEDN